MTPREFVDKLNGMEEHEIVQYLRTKEIKGIPMATGSCPLALLAKTEITTPIFELEVTTEGIEFIAVNARDAEYPRDYVYLYFGNGAKDFVFHFDDGQFPEFDITEDEDG